MSLLFVDLGLSPVANAFRRREQAGLAESFYPLRAYVCANCKLVQLGQSLPREQLFPPDYAYFSSYSETWLRHAEAFVEQAVRDLALDSSSRVVEIGSNDGYLLQFILARGIGALGIEPSGNVAEAARSRGVPTIERFFGAGVARELRQEDPAPALVVANNVLAHVPDLADFLDGLVTLADQSTVISIEVPELLALLRDNQFDTIYHEHYSYFSFHSLERILALHGLAVFDLEELPTHGGSMRLFVCLRAAGRAESPRVRAQRQREQAAGLDGLDIYKGFGARVRQTKRQLLRLLIAIRDAGKSIAAYGAPAKGNTLLNYCGIRTDLVDFTVDRNPHKQGLLLPGSSIPVYAPDEIGLRRPDYLLILPWNLRDEIMDQMSFIRAWGGQFVVPIPAPTIVP